MKTPEFVNNVIKGLILPSKKVAPVVSTAEKELMASLKSTAPLAQQVEQNANKLTYPLKPFGKEVVPEQILDYTGGAPVLKKAELIKTAVDIGKILPYLLIGAGVPTAAYGLHQMFKPKSWQDKMKSSLHDVKTDLKEFLPALGMLPMMGMSPMGLQDNMMGGYPMMPPPPMGMPIMSNPNIMQAQNQMQQFSPFTI